MFLKNHRRGGGGQDLLLETGGNRYRGLFIEGVTRSFSLVIYRFCSNNFFAQDAFYLCLFFVYFFFNSF